jgi:hypothetical protein
VLLYGVVYTLIHDGLVHQRWFRYVPRGGYAKRLVQAHRLHHATVGKQGGVSFGFVFARDPAVLKRELAEQRKAGIAVLRDVKGKRRKAGVLHPAPDVLSAGGVHGFGGGQALLRRRLSFRWHGGVLMPAARQTWRLD